MSSVKIEFKDLSKRYKDVLAVSNFSAQVQSGRVTGFLGPNGAGKSTALRCLLGLVNPTGGSAEINGGSYLSLAIAMLGDPEILILDEPANGLDPLGIVWLREFLQKLAGEGRTILVSSHQLAEMQNTVNDVLIINKGVLVAQGTIKEICKGRSLEEAFLELTLRKSA